MTEHKQAVADALAVAALARSIRQSMSDRGVIEQKDVETHLDVLAAEVRRLTAAAPAREEAAFREGFRAAERIRASEWPCDMNVNAETEAVVAWQKRRAR
jgi:hypothetical protein